MDAAEAEQGTESPLDFHIVGGEEAPEGEFPFMAVLGYANPDTTGSFVYRCGASLISPNFLLTAAHCKYSDGEPEVALLTIRVEMYLCKKKFLKKNPEQIPGDIS